MGIIRELADLASKINITSNALNLKSGTFFNAPAQPYFRVRGLSNPATNGYVTTLPAVLKFSTEIYDNGGNYDTATGRWTCPAGAGGIFVFSGSILVDDNSASSTTVAHLHKNGSVEVTSLVYESDGNDYTHASFSTPVEVADGDYIELYGGNGHIHVGSETQFGCVKVA